MSGASLSAYERGGYQHPAGSPDRSPHPERHHHGHHHHHHHHLAHLQQNTSGAEGDASMRRGWMMVDDDDGSVHPRHCQCAACSLDPPGQPSHNRSNHDSGPLQADTGTYVLKGTEWVVVDDYGEHPRGCLCAICIAGPPDQRRNDRERYQGDSREGREQHRSRNHASSGHDTRSSYHRTTPPTTGILHPTRAPMPYPVNAQHLEAANPASTSAFHAPRYPASIPSMSPPPMWVQPPGTPYRTPYPPPIIPVVQSIAVPVVPVYTVPAWVPVSVQWVPFPLPAANPPGPSSAFNAVQTSPLHTPTSTHPPVEISPWLIPNPVDRSIAHLKWDMSLPPTTAKRMSGTGIITSLKNKFNDLATDPPVRHLQVICPVGPAEPDGLGLLWPNIDVKKDKNITLGDVLWAVYDFLNKPLTEHEVNHVKTKLIEAQKHFPYYEPLERTAMQRSQASQRIGAVSKTGPFLRIDCMGTSQRFFYGMVILGDAPGGNRWWLVMYGRPKPDW